MNEMCTIRYLSRPVNLTKTRVAVKCTTSHLLQSTSVRRVWVEIRRYCQLSAQKMDKHQTTNLGRGHSPKTVMKTISYTTNIYQVTIQRKRDPCPVLMQCVDRTPHHDEQTSHTRYEAAVLNMRVIPVIFPRSRCRENAPIAPDPSQDTSNVSSAV